MLDITTKLSTALLQLVSIFVSNTSLVDSTTSTGNSDGLTVDLAVVAETGTVDTSLSECRTILTVLVILSTSSTRLSSRKYVVQTFRDTRVTRCGQCVCLPLVVDSGCFGLADRAHERGLVTSDHRNKVSEIFPLRDVGVSTARSNVSTGAASGHTTLRNNSH